MIGPEAQDDTDPCIPKRLIAPENLESEWLEKMAQRVEQTLEELRKQMMSLLMMARRNTEEDEQLSKVAARVNKWLRELKALREEQEKRKRSGSKLPIRQANAEERRIQEVTAALEADRSEQKAFCQRVGSFLAGLLRPWKRGR